jgi:hypothetical protein
MLAQVVSTHVFNASQLESFVQASSAALHELVSAHVVQPAQSAGLQDAPELEALDALEALELDVAPELLELLELDRGAPELLAPVVELAFPPPPPELPLPQLAANMIGITA